MACPFWSVATGASQCPVAGGPSRFLEVCSMPPQSISPVTSALRPGWCHTCFYSDGTQPSHLNTQRYQHRFSSHFSFVLPIFHTRDDPCPPLLSSAGGEHFCGLVGFSCSRCLHFTFIVCMCARACVGLM